MVQSMINKERRLKPSYRHRLMLLIAIVWLLLAGPASAAMIILPRDAELVLGVYGGVAQHQAGVEILSSDAGRDGRRQDYDASAAMAGALLGFQGKRYRFSSSFDQLEGGRARQQRLLFNFTYFFGDHISPGGFRPMIGAGVGAADSHYQSESGSSSISTGSWVLRGGFEYGLSVDRSLELLLEYARPYSPGRDSEFSGDHFTITRLVEQQLLMLRIGYNFKLF